jgi:hypothetical protein
MGVMVSSGGLEFGGGQPSGGRRADLDWVRVGAFLLLIFYHVGMAFVTWDWHVKTAHPSMFLQPAMVLLNPWRLSLLFFVSGCATRFMAERLAPSRLAWARLGRLGIPLLFGMLVVVPPQSWVQVREHGYSIGYLAFYRRYLAADQSFCDAHGCLILPTWNHLWFVAYLLVYTLLLMGVLAVAPRVMRWVGRAAPMMSGIGALLWPAAWLVLMRFTLAPRFDETHALVGDWYAHSEYAAVFLLGFAVAGWPPFWHALVRLRWATLSVALPACVGWAIYAYFYEGDAVPPDALRWAMRVDYGVDQWFCIAAVLGFARVHLRRGSALLDYLTQGVFPFYIVHQTIIVVMEFYLKRLGWPQWVEGSLLIVATGAGCLLTYEIVRRVAILRPLFGLRTGRIGRITAKEEGRILLF